MDRTSTVDKDFYKKHTDDILTGESIITFKHPEPSEFAQLKYDWYILVALEKADQVVQDRHLLTKSLLLQYRWAIREAYQHQLDPTMTSAWSHPRNRNTIKGIQSYIDNIKKKSEVQGE